MNSSRGGPRFGPAHELMNRWIVQTFEPLVDTRTRAVTERRLARLLEVEPIWIGAWFTGAISGILTTLPNNDPWRHTSVRLPSGRSWLDKEVGRPPAGHTGAWTRRGRLGTPTDNTDLLTPDTLIREADLKMAGGHGWMEPRAVNILAACAHGWREGFEAFWESALETTSNLDSEANKIRSIRNTADLERLINSDTSQKVGNLFEDLERALRSVLHRRRIYIGNDDLESYINLLNGFAPCDELANRYDMRPDPELDGLIPLAGWANGIDAFDWWEFDTDTIEADAWTNYHLDEPAPPTDDTFWSHVPGTSPRG